MIRLRLLDWLRENSPCTSPKLSKSKLFYMMGQYFFVRIMDLFPFHRSIRVYLLSRSRRIVRSGADAGGSVATPLSFSSMNRATSSFAKSILMTLMNSLLIRSSTIKLKLTATIVSPLLKYVFLNEPLSSILNEVGVECRP